MTTPSVENVAWTLLRNDGDFTDFVNEYRTDGRGGATFHPRMMTTLTFYAYCDGKRSSRQIEDGARPTWPTGTVHHGNNRIDHVTICRFRDRFEDQLAALFAPVLAVCLKAGLGDLSLAAIDGTKLRCPASRNWSAISIVPRYRR